MVAIAIKRAGIRARMSARTRVRVRLYNDHEHDLELMDGMME